MVRRIGCQPSHRLRPGGEAVSDRKLIEEARDVMEGKGRSLHGFPDNPPAYIKHLVDRCHDLFGMLEKVTKALETAEQREDRTDTMLTIAIGTRDDALRQLDAVRALLPALKALDEAAGAIQAECDASLESGRREMMDGCAELGEVGMEAPPCDCAQCLLARKILSLLNPANPRLAIAKAVRILDGGK